MIKNFNVNLDEMSGGAGDFWGGLLAAVAVVAGVLVAIFVPGGILISAFLGLATTAGVAGASYLAVTLQSNPDWGNGLISIYHEEGLGKAGEYYKQVEKGSIFLDANTKKLSVQRGWSNGTYTFDVDGWSGRYGMPLEFLLSVHLATQMPDLAIDMATSFDTDVEVLLHKVDGEMTAGVLKEGATGTGDDSFITYAEVEAIGKEERGLLAAAWEGALDFVNFIGGVFTGGGDIWTDEELDQLAFNDRAFLIAPTQEIYEKINAAYPDVTWLHPDLFAAYLMDIGHTAPVKGDFRQICLQYATGVVYLVNLNEGQVLDCQTFSVLKKDYITGRAPIQERVLPFYSRIGDVNSNWFSYIINDVKTQDYYLYFDALLKGEIKDEDATFFGRITNYFTQSIKNIF